MKKLKYIKDFCTNCNKEYKAEVQFYVWNMPVPKGHSCKEHKEYIIAQNKRWGLAK